MTIIESFHFVRSFQFLHIGNTIHVQLCCFRSPSTSAYGNPHFLWQSSQRPLWGDQQSAFHFLRCCFYQFWTSFFMVIRQYSRCFQFLHQVLNGRLRRRFRTLNCAINCRWQVFKEWVFQWVWTMNTHCFTVNWPILLVKTNHYPVRHKAFVLS